MCDINEPFTNLLTQGMVIKDGSKMSKSVGNVVDPDDMIAKYGIPWSKAPICTRELKQYAIQSYLKELNITKEESSITSSKVC